MMWPDGDTILIPKMSTGSRRRVLLAIAGSGLSTLAGCLSALDDDESADEQPEEYTPTESPQATEEISGPNPLDESARKQSIDAKTAAFVDTEVGFPDSRSHVESYHFSGLNVTLMPNGRLFEELSATEEYAVQAFAHRFPDGDIVGSGHSEFFQPDGITDPEQKVVEIDYRENVVNEQVSITVRYSQEIFDGDESASISQTVGAGQLFAGTDPFTVTEQGIQEYSTPHDRESTEIDYSDLTTSDNHPTEGKYTVHSSEGGYFVFFETETPPQFPPILLKVPFYIPKQTFARWKSISRPEYPEPPAERTSYVTDSRKKGIGQFVGEMLDITAEFHGFYSDREKIEYIATFVQSLPYALDQISTGFTDYSRLPAETLVDAQGDCVDTSILLGVALLESTVSCDIAFFSYSPRATGSGDSGHLAVGIAPDNVSYDPAPAMVSQGTQYYYIEPTVFMKPGKVPPQIDFEQTEIHHIS